MLDLAQLNDELSCEWELAVIGDHETHSVLKDEVHLGLCGMGDLNFDKHRVSERPGFGGFGFWHPQKMKGIAQPRQISLVAAFQLLTDQKASHRKVSRIPTWVHHRP